MSEAKTFRYQGVDLEYFSHRYNVAWGNERTIEIPIALYHLEEFSGSRILEVGNVLGCYVKRAWDCVDLYDSSPGLIKADILTFSPAIPYDFIFSISTLEHVRYDEPTKDPTALKQAIEHLRRLLAPGGQLVVTLPFGYNPAVNHEVEVGCLCIVPCTFMRRISADNLWEECTREQALVCHYGNPYSAANAIVIVRSSG